MVLSGASVLAAATPRRKRTSNPQRHALRTDKLTGKLSYPPFYVFSFGPKIFYNPFMILLECEQRILKQPILKVHRLVSRSIREGALRSLVQFITNKKLDREPFQSSSAGRQSRRCRAEARRCCEKAKKSEKDRDIESAITWAERAAELQPNNVTYLALLSKQHSDMSFAENVTKEKATETLLRALEIADRIVELEPKNPVGHIAQGVSKGRLAYYSGNKRKIELAKEAEDRIRQGLLLDDKCDIGHHLIGRFQYEMAGLNVLCRAIVRIVYQQQLSPGSYDEALKSFKKAHELRPDRLVHKILLGKTYTKLGKHGMAVEMLRDAVKMKVLDHNDYMEMKDAEKLLKMLEKSGR